MPSKRCHGDYRRNRLPPLLPKDYRLRYTSLPESRLRKPDWNSIQLSTIEKNLYQEHPNTAKRPYSADRDYLRANWVTVTGEGAVPKPVLRLEEANFPKCIEDGVRAFYQGPPGPVEAQCWPVALGGKDLLAFTPALGSRKVLAYLLPAIAHILQQPSQQGAGASVALVLAPTRELVDQIHQVAKQLEPYTGVRSVCVVGGRPKDPQLDELRNAQGICVAMPGRLLELLKEGAINLHRCTYLVLEEADRMLQIGLGNVILAIVSQIRPDRQMLVFTTSWLVDVRAFALPLLRGYIEASFAIPAHCGSQRVECIAHVCEVNEKEDKLMALLEDLLNSESLKIVVIANSRRKIDNLVTRIGSRGWTAVGFYGKKTREERDWSLNAFRSGAASFLVGTPKAMQYLVLQGVRTVVNFDVAETSMEYRRRMLYAASPSESGAMHTLVGPEDSRHVRALISFLRETHQTVDPELICIDEGTLRSRKIEQKLSSPEDTPENSGGC